MNDAVLPDGDKGVVITRVSSISKGSRERADMIIISRYHKKDGNYLGNSYVRQKSRSCHPYDQNGGKRRVQVHLLVV